MTRNRLAALLLITLFSAPLITSALTQQEKNTLLLQLIQKVLELNQKLVALGGTPIQLPPGLASLTQQPQQGSTCTLSRTLSLGMRGDDVSCLQRFLIQQHLLAPENATGYFGRLTAAAVASFQRSHGLEPVGSVGRLTRAIVNTAPPAAPPVTTPPPAGGGGSTTPPPVGGGGGGGGGGGTPPPPPPVTHASCTQDGITLAHGESRLFYSALSVASPATCTSISQNRACHDGSLSGLSSYAYATCVVTGSGDMTPPTVSITVPAASSTVSGTVSIAATASDNVGVAGVQFKLDGVNLGAENTTAPYSASWNTASTTGGTHTLSAVARDAAGNRATSTISVTVSSSTSTPIGIFALVQSAGSRSLRGWAYDPKASSQSVSIRIYADGSARTGTLAGTIIADVSRPDVNAIKGITGNHGFDWQIPEKYLGQSHTFYLYAVNTDPAGKDTLLVNSAQKMFVSPIIGTLYAMFFPSYVANSNMWFSQPFFSDPLLGYYDSVAPSVIAQHATWMASTGIDYALIGWSNNLDNYLMKQKYPSDGVGTMDPEMILRVNTAVLFAEYDKLAKAGKPHPKVSILIGIPNKVCSGKVPTDCVTAQEIVDSQILKDEVDYIYNNYVLKYPDIYQFVDGKPLLVNFAGAGAPAAATMQWKDPRFEVRVMSAYLETLKSSGQLPNPNTLWSNLDRVPEVAYKDGAAESVTVISATPGRAAYGGWCADGIPSHGQGTCPDPLWPAQGHSDGLFAKQWAFATSKHPHFIFVSQWNQFAPVNGLGDLQPNLNYSADLEPTVATGCSQIQAVQNLISAYEGRTFPALDCSVTPYRGSVFVSQDVPAVMEAGKTYPVTLVFRNNSSNTWKASGVRLGASVSATTTVWGVLRATLSQDIAPGATATFSFSVKAPATPGTYDFQWRLVDTGLWFGDKSANVRVQVN